MNNKTQTDILLSLLQLNQIIKVDVLERISSTQYLISYKNIRLTAVSEADLRSKAVWLKVTQKTPIPKLQLIIEEKDSKIKGFLDFVTENNLPLPEMPAWILDLPIGSFKNNELYGFIKLQSQRANWGLFTDNHFASFISAGVSINDLDMVYNTGSDNSKRELLEQHCFTALLFDETDIEVLKPRVEALKRVNSIIFSIFDLNSDIALYLYVIQIKNSFIVIPMERFMYKTSGLLCTKYFGNIIINIVLSKANFVFENNIYKNAFADVLVNAKGDDDYLNTLAKNVIAIINKDISLD